MYRRLVKFLSFVSVLMITILGISFTSCNYNPLQEKELIVSQPKKESATGFKATFYGNTTFHITDGETNFLVDGFFSRPGIGSTFLGKYKPDYGEVTKWLNYIKVKKWDAILVGHTHGDHALDAPMVSDLTGAPVMGSRSYANIHESYGADMRKVIKVCPEGGKKTFGKFTVRFLKSDHIRPTTCYQHKLEGHVEKPFGIPAKFTDFKCGDIYAIHISHPKGNIAITTSAGASKRQWKGLKADVVFLGIGLLSRITDKEREDYWKNAVEPLKSHKGLTVIPVHWDSFMRTLDKGLKPPPAIIDNTRKTMRFLKKKAKESGGIQLKVLDVSDSYCF